MRIKEAVQPYIKKLKLVLLMVYGILIGTTGAILYYEGKELKEHGIIVTIKEYYRVEVIKEIPIEPISAGDKKTIIIKDLAFKYKIDWKIVRAICDVESNCSSQRVGDGGKSFGAYQIYSVAHPNISKTQATDFKWATEWTIKRLKKHEHLGRDEMIRSHNGLVKSKSNQWYVNKVNNKIKQL